VETKAAATNTITILNEIIEKLDFDIEKSKGDKSSSTDTESIEGTLSPTDGSVINDMPVRKGDMLSYSSHSEIAFAFR
jgi:hypothetical protein